MKLDEFVHATNLLRYERMLAESKNEGERQMIRKLLAEEMVKHKQRSETGLRRGSDGASARSAPPASDATSERARSGADYQP
jgi:hypothetical protein